MAKRSASGAFVIVCFAVGSAGAYMLLVALDKQGTMIQRSLTFHTFTRHFLPMFRTGTFKFDKDQHRCFSIAVTMLSLPIIDHV